MPPPVEPVYFASPEDWRSWLAEHHSDLHAAGRVTPAAEAAFAARRADRSGVYSFERPPQELDAEQLAAFRAGRTTTERPG